MSSAHISNYVWALCILGRRSFSSCVVDSLPPFIFWSYIQVVGGGHVSFVCISFNNLLVSLWLYEFGAMFHKSFHRQIKEIYLFSLFSDSCFIFYISSAHLILILVLKVKCNITHRAIELAQHCLLALFWNATYIKYIMYLNTSFSLHVSELYCVLPICLFSCHPHAYRKVKHTHAYKWICLAGWIWQWSFTCNHTQTKKPKAQKTPGWLWASALPPLSPGRGWIPSSLLHHCLPYVRNWKSK